MINQFHAEVVRKLTTNYQILLSQVDVTIPHFISVLLHFCSFEVLMGV